MTLGRTLERVPPRLVYVALVTLLLASYLVHHAALGLRFPIPWPDEGSFLWQAIAVQEHSTLFAPQLNPERTVMWMPPGYMVVQGLLFKVTGFSLQWARTLSALYLCGAIACLAALLVHLRRRFFHLVLLGVFLHSPALLLAGNVARMESLVLLVGLAGVLLVQRGAIYPGLSLLSLAPLAHPNGLFFCLGGVLVAVPMVWREPRRLRPTRVGVIVLLLAAACWVAYGLQVVQNWQHFVHDMRYQLQLKHDWYWQGGMAAWGRRLLAPSVLVPNLMLAGALLYAQRFRLPVQHLIALAVALQLLSCCSPGWLYDVYVAAGVLLVSILAVEVLPDALARLRRPAGPGPGLAAAAAVTLAIAILDGHALANDPTLAGTLASIRTPGGVHRGPEYFTAEDRRAIAGFLESLQRSPRPLTVQFFPEADALLVREQETAAVRFLQPTIYPMVSDVYVVHQSRRIPKGVQDWIGLSVVFRDGVSVPFKDWMVIHERDATERWLVYQRPQRAPAKIAKITP